MQSCAIFDKIEFILTVLSFLFLIAPTEQQQRAPFNVATHPRL